VPLGGSPPPPVEKAPVTYTPRHLAEKILGARSALEGERKQVTVLFADVKGSMELAEAVDPEEWHRIMDRFFAILTEGVHRFEGTVNQYTGDGIMALFGAPIAHEDHAQRACYAALHLGGELRRYATELRLGRGLSFAVRMGLNSGEVVVGKIGDDLRMDYTAQGHTVGLAARMEQLAEAGRIYLTSHTAGLVEGYFALAELGALAVKGAREPVRVYELCGVGPMRTRLDVSKRRGFSRFVGRTDEMAALEAALAQALAGHGRVVGVVAEPGVGKSRLCYEFTQRCRAQRIAVFEAQGVAHGKAIPYLPILQLFRAALGITERDSTQAAREKIAGRFLLLDSALGESLPLAFEFLGVPDPERPAPRMDPDAQQRQLFEIVRRVTKARSRREPEVTLLEDLHWFDEGSEAFLELVVDLAAETRTLVLLNFRPEFHARWMQRSYYRQLPLVPLGAEAIAELLRDQLGTHASVAGLTRLIEERTAGNPFFVEEVVQTLAETGTIEGARGSYRLSRPVESIGIPPTVQALLGARIDRLPEHEKELLQTAAVIGMDFAEPVLRRVAGHAASLEAALRTLKDAEFVFEQALYPEAEYAFKHPLTREVAYQSQLGERRARTHAAVARVIAELSPDRLDERAALLAHHWEAAGEPLEAARWSRRAAEWVGWSDSAQAVRHWEKVRALLDRAEQSPEVVGLSLFARAALLNVGWRLGMTEENAARLLAEGRALGERGGEKGPLALLLQGYGTVRGTAGAVDEFFTYSTEAVRLAEGAAAGEKAALLVASSYPRYLVGRVAEALACLDDFLALGDRAPSPRVVYASPSFPFWWRSVLLLEMGRVAEAVQALELAESRAREGNDTEILGWAHYTRAAWVDMLGGDLDTALGHARQSLEIALRIGSVFSTVTAYRGLGQIHCLREEWDEGLRAVEENLAGMEARRTGLEQRPAVLAILADLQFGRGDLPRARAAAEEGIALARQMGTPVWEVHCQLALARVLRGSEGVADAGAITAALDRAFEIVCETGARRNEPYVHLERAELARLRGDSGAWASELGRAQRLFAGMGAAVRAEKAAHDLTRGMPAVAERGAAS
jgi:class 3 adenylate cyclase/tetratricopeptide (TPR) repeat protein